MLDRIIDALGVKPGVSPMIAALLQVALLAGAATLMGVSVHPTDWKVVGGAILIMSAVNEVARRIVLWRAVNKPLEDARTAAAKERDDLRNVLTTHGGTWGETARWLAPRLKAAEQYLAANRRGMINENIYGGAAIKDIDDQQAARIMADDYDPLKEPRFGPG